MNSSVKISTAIIAVLGLAGFIIVKDYSGTGMLQHHGLTTTIYTADKQKTDLFNQHIVDTAITMVRSGDVVLRKGLGADSYLLAMMNQKDKTYSHCGIVMIENGYPFIYHSIGGEDNPDERLRRDSASLFFSPLHNICIAIVRYNYDYDYEKISKLREIVYQYYKKKPQFDIKFDLTTDDKLYCSEFVYKAVNEAAGDPSYIGTSSIKGKPYVAIDNLFLNPHAHIVWQTKFKQYLYNQK